jgi:hypothetical protein
VHRREVDRGDWGLEEGAALERGEVDVDPVGAGDHAADVGEPAHGGDSAPEQAGGGRELGVGDARPLGFPNRDDCPEDLGEAFGLGEGVFVAPVQGQLV